MREPGAARPSIGGSVAACAITACVFPVPGGAAIQVTPYASRSARVIAAPASATGTSAATAATPCRCSARRGETAVVAIVSPAVSVNCEMSRASRAVRREA